MNYRDSAIQWSKTFPFTVLCAIMSIVLTINPSIVNVEFLKTYLFNQYAGWNMWIIGLIPFGFGLVTLVKLVLKQFKKKKQYTNDGKISYRFIFDVIHVPMFYAIDLTAIFGMIIGLLIICVPEAAKPEYHQIHIFEVFFNAFCVPYVSIIYYYGKTLWEESAPHSIINHLK